MAKGMRPLDAPDVAAPIAVSEAPDVAGIGPPVCRCTLAVALAAPVPAALTACVLSEVYWPFDSAVALLQATASPSCMDSRVSVRCQTPTRQRVIPRCCMDARLKSHVVTGWTSPISLESGRGDEVFKLYMGFGCRLYIAGSPRCPANMYN